MTEEIKKEKYVEVDKNLAIETSFPETGLVPTIAMALAATVVNRKEMPATNTMATNVCNRFPCMTSR